MAFLNESFIVTIDFKDLELTDLREKRFDPDFKVQKIVNCPTLTDFINNYDFSLINQTSHLFFIHVEILRTIENYSETDHTLLQLMVQNNLIDSSRPLVVELFFLDTKKSVILYKDERDELLQKKGEVQPLSRDEFNELINNETGFKFGSVLQVFSSNWLVDFERNLLESKINQTSIESMKKGLTKCSCLSIRFIRLHDSNRSSLTLKHLNVLLESRVESTGVGRLLAYLDLPFQIDGDVMIPEEQRKQISQIKSKQQNLLELSVEKGRYDFVRYFAKNFSFYLEIASQLAVGTKSYECFYELLNAGSKFTANFEINNLNDSESCQKLRKLIKDRESFHEDIKSGSLEKVKEFLQTNSSSVKTFFSMENKSALTTSLEACKFNIYAFFQSKGLSKEGDSFYDGCLESLTTKQKEELRDAHKEYFKSFEEHLVTLLTKTRLSNGSTEGENNYFQIIRHMYQELDGIPDIRPVLKAIACSKDLKIVFDFNQSSVQDVDPTKSEGVRGTSYHKMGYIYVGAKRCQIEGRQNEFYNIIGTLVHEMTHYAMHLVFKNNCKPYAATDTERLNKYAVILNKTKEIDDVSKDKSDDIISRVFINYGADTKPEERLYIWQVELIVRVPQLLAQYKSSDVSKLKSIRKTFSDLFNFYDEILPDLIHFQEIEKCKSLIENINRQGSLLNVILKEKDHFIQNELLGHFSQQNEWNFVLSNVTIMTLVSIFLKLENSGEENNNMFLNVDSIVNNKKLKQDIRKAYDSEVRPMVVVDCTNKFKINLEYIKEFLNIFEDKSRVIIVASKKEGIVSKHQLPYEKNINRAHQIEHSWEEVEESYKETLMEREMLFQSSSVKLNQLLDSKSRAMLEFPLNSLLKNKTIESNEQNISVGSTFIERKFLHKNLLQDEEDPQVYQRQLKRKYKSNADGMNLGATVTNTKFVYTEKSFEEVMIHGDQKGVVIISDKAGTGKSTVLSSIGRELRKRNRLKWVRLVDLKQYVNEFDAVSKDISQFDEFLISTVFKQLNAFDRKLFLHLYQQGKTIVLLDGFDEISPKYKNLWRKVLQSFNSETGNQLWITTRSHLEQSLENFLKQSSFGLLPFSDSEQYEYLTLSWTSKAGESHSVEIESKAREIIEKLNNVSSSEVSSIGAPLILSMLVELFEKGKLMIQNSNQDTNLFVIYEHFIEHLIKNWTTKGPLAEEERLETHKSNLNVWQIHERIAIQHLFGTQKWGINLKYDKKDWTSEKLSRIGIFLTKDGLGNFQHETFAEFFVARYIWTNLHLTGSERNRALRVLIEVMERKDAQIIR